MTDPKPIPLEVLAEHLIAVGKTGSGKTVVGKRAAEELLDAGRRVCIVDPAGVWWGLRSSADGTAGAYRVTIFGGEHGDVPIGEHSGRPLAKLIAEGNLPAIVDVSEMTLSAQRRFATEFFETLYRLNRKALHLIIDEADVFAPQQPLPDQRVMVHRVDQIARRGRVKGFRLMAITQRPAVLHKNMMSQCGTLVAMRLMAPQDRKAVEDWIKGQADMAEGKRVLNSLPKLKTGEGWLWSPDHGILDRRRFPMIRTFDSSRTPDDDEQIPEPQALADVDIAGLAEALNPQAEETTIPYGGITENRPSKADLKAEREKSEIEGYHSGYADGWRRGRADITARMVEKINELQEGYPPNPDHIPSATLKSRPEGVDAPVSLTETLKRKSAPKSAKSAHSGNGALSPAARAWLTQFCGRQPLRLTWTQAGALMGRKARGGHFNATRKELIDGGYVEEVDGGIVEPTDKAFEALGELRAPSADPVEACRAALPTGPRALFEALRMHGPMTAEELGGATGRKPRGGHWNASMKLLRTSDLIAVEHGRIRLADWLIDSRNGR